MKHLKQQKTVSCGMSSGTDGKTNQKTFTETNECEAALIKKKGISDCRA